MPILVTHNNSFTARQRECVEAYFAGHTSDKDLARHLGISIAALRSRLNGLWHRAGMPFGARRDQAMLALWHKGLIDLRRQAAEAIRRAAMVLLCILSSTSCLDGHALRQRTRSHGRAPVVSMARTARRAEYFIDPDNLEAAA